MSGRAAILLMGTVLGVGSAQEFRPPAGNRPVQKRPLAPSIIPGGRVIAPVGVQFHTGPGPFGLAVCRGGRYTATADGGPHRYSITIVEKHKNLQRDVTHFVAKVPREDRDDDDKEWHSVFMGLAFADEKNLFASDGNSGKVRVINPADGSTRREFDLNQDFRGASYKDSYTGDLAFDGDRELLYVVDQANFRVVTINTREREIVASTKVGRLPFAVALSPDKRKLYVTNTGMFEYARVPGADPGSSVTTGLPFPAFGFPSAESQAGTTAKNGAGREVKVPGLGDPNARESNSVCIVNVENPASPVVEAFVRTGKAFGAEGVAGGSSPSGVAATAEAIYVSNGYNDSITVIDARSHAVTAEVPIRIPGLEQYRGVLPIGVAVDATKSWLFIAEAGINAVGVMDMKANRMIGHIPAAWFPTRVAVEADEVYVTNAKGHGTGPNARAFEDDTFAGVLRRGSLSIYQSPAQAELANLTGKVFANNGFFPAKVSPPPIPAEIQHVVLIVKENRTFDEVLGSIRETANGKVNAFPPLGRLGRRGYANGRGDRFSLQDINVTPNHQKLAETYAFSDNFYSDAEFSADGHHWLAGAYPNAWTESTLMAAHGGQKDFRLPTTAPGRLSFPGADAAVHPEGQPEAGTIWHHFERHGITFRNFGAGFELAGSFEQPGTAPTGARFLVNVPMPEPLYRNTSREYPGFNMSIPDQYRASQFIQEIDRDFVKPEKPLPRFLYVRLPNDHMAAPRPENGYPYQESYVADNDYALGRIVAYLSGTPYWKNMLILVTEDDAQGGRDHVDSHRTVMMAIGPWVRRNHVSHVNASFPSLLKLIFRVLRIPPLNMFDATAADLAEIFSSEPESSPYQAEPIDSRLFDPEKTKEPGDQTDLQERNHGK